MTKLLIDADFFLYRAVQSSELELEFNPDCTVITGDFKHAQGMFKRNLKDLTTRFDTQDILLCFTDRVNFRKTVDPSYKGNRIKRKPAGYSKAKTWAMETYPSIIMPTLEADDVLGILATRGDLTDFVLVSPDKDMEQIPCRLYNLKDEFTQTPELAERKLYEQALTGDSTDGYKGCPGVGPKRAGILLDKCKGDYWPAVLEAFEEAGQSEKEALTSIRLAKILHHSDWDAETQTPILFTPQ